MKTEVQCACAFFSRMLQQKKVPAQFTEIFRNKLEDLLLERFENHWDASNPNKGSAYRCIRINSKMDPIIEAASRVTGLPNFRKLLPAEFTMWIDPDDVSYRFGEDGSICSCSFDAELYTPSINSFSRSAKCRADVVMSSKKLSPLLSSTSAYSYGANVYGGFSTNYLDYAIPVQV